VGGQQMFRCYDTYGTGCDVKSGLELSEVGWSSQDVAFCIKVENSSEVYYSHSCYSSNHLFGCFGLKHQSYCILNKKYSEAEYYNQLRKIVPHMKGTKEWGEFFDLKHSLFGYNETAAQTHFPISELVAREKGLRWSLYENILAEPQEVLPNNILPDTWADISDTLAGKTVICRTTKKPFRITALECKLHKGFKLPIPLQHPEIRLERLMKYRQPYFLYQINCIKCNSDTLSVYPQDFKRPVVCPSCYKYLDSAEYLSELKNGAVAQ